MVFSLVARAGIRVIHMLAISAGAVAYNKEKKRIFSAACARKVARRSMHHTVSAAPVEVPQMFSEHQNRETNVNFHVGWRRIQELRVVHFASGAGKY